MTCIIKSDIENAKKALQEEGYRFTNWHKKYTTTESRVDFLEKHFNDRTEAEFFNKKFENMLLKKQKDKLREWVKKGTKEGIDTGTTKNLLEKIDSLTDVLKKADKSFYEGLIKQKLGFTISVDEAKTILDMNNNIKATKRAVLKKYPDYLTWIDQEGIEKFSTALEEELKTIQPDGTGGGVITDMAASIMALKRVYDDAKVAADKKETTKTKTGKVLYGVSTAMGLIKSVKASWDISFGRQLSLAFAGGQFSSAAKGWKAGVKTFAKAFTAKSNEEAERKLSMIEGLLMARPNAINGNYRKLGVAVGLREEAFPETVLTKHWKGQGNIFYSSDAAFNVAIQTARANITDNLIAQSGGDIGLLKSQGGGDYVNYITGRGKIPGGNDPKYARFVNTMLFSPRWLSSRVQSLMDIPKIRYMFSDSKANMIDKLRGKAAFANIVFMTTLPMLLKGAMRAIDDDKEYGEEEWEQILSAFDARSSDFGKLVWGDTRFDTSFGTSGLIVAATRALSGQKITVSGVKRDANTWDTVGAFIEGKVSPGARTVKDTWTKLLDGEDAKNFMYQPITWGGLLQQTVAPISLENAIEQFQMETESRTASIVGVLLDIVGVGANTYGIDEKSKGKSDSVISAENELAWKSDRNPSDIKPSSNSQIMTDLKGDRQEQAISDFSKEWNKEATKLVNSSKYKNASIEEKSDMFQKVRADVNKKIKQKYNLKPKKKK